MNHLFPQATSEPNQNQLSAFVTNMAPGVLGPKPQGKFTIWFFYREDIRDTKLL